MIEKRIKTKYIVDKKNYIVAVDIGSSEVVVAVGSIAEGGVMNIEAVAAEHTDGMAAGLVDNSQMVADALRRARISAEQQAGIAITEAYVAISGKFVRCARYTDHVFVEDAENCISSRDLAALSERMRNVKASDGEIIMDFFPLCYKSDTGTEMKNPVGCYSKQLSSTYNFILCEHTAKDRLRRVFLDAGIKMRELYAGAAIVGESVVNSEEKEEGVAVIDIGSGVTDVAIYYGGVLCYIASIPMGGSALNADIRVYDGYIPPRIVENLKKQLGSAVVDLTPDEMIQMRSRSRSIKPISRLNLAAVIEARMTDIAEYAWGEIKEAGYAKKLGAGIVLTGGVAELMNVGELFHRVTGQEVRTACAEVGITTESLEKVSSPNLALAVSILLRGAQTGPSRVGAYIPTTPVTKAEEPKAEASKVQEAPKAEPKVEPKPEPKREEPRTEPKPDPKPEPKRRDDWDDEEDDDVEIDDGDNDIAEKKGWFGRIFSRAKSSFSDAFKDPNEDIDEDERW